MSLQNQRTSERRDVLSLPGVELRLTAEHALRAAIDNQVFASLRDLESLDGGRAVQAVYVALIRRLPNVMPDRKRLAIDTGFSESSIKRAISLLERSKLVRVKRSKGHSSNYVLADIRALEVASECVAVIKKLARGFSPRREEGQATSEPTECESRVTSEPGSRATSEPRVGPLLTHKEANKIQPKQQCAAAGLLERTLKRWGLESASYLAVSGHRQAIPELAQDPEFAARVIDAAMRKGSWSGSAGVGSKVAFLREEVPVITERLSNATLNQPLAMRRDFPREAAPDSEHDECRAKAESMVASMSEAEFHAACELLFAERPGLQKLYAMPTRGSRGLHALLVQAAMQSLAAASSSAANQEPCSPMQAAS
jgi:hypothetical protein